MERKPQRAQTLAEQAVDAIRAHIVGGRFQLGEALSESTLAAELGINKGPVREALLQLRLEGLVDIQPEHGSFVFQMSAQEVAELSDLREILETAAALRALERDQAGVAKVLDAIVRRMGTAMERDDFATYRNLDADFHQAIVDHCGNDFLKESYAAITFRVQALRSRLSTDTAFSAVSLTEHRQILAQFQAGDAMRLRAVLSAHIFGARQNYVEVLADPIPPPAQR